MPVEYTSAVSNMLTPASRQMSTRRVASLTSVAPHALKNSLPPPKVPVPKLRTGTLKPESPSRRNSIEPPALRLPSLKSTGRPRYNPRHADEEEREEGVAAGRDAEPDCRLLGITSDLRRGEAEPRRLDEGRSAHRRR